MVYLLKRRRMDVWTPENSGSDHKNTRNSGIFMFGMDRSGTTLLSMIVGAHPDIAVPLSATGLWYRLDQQQEAYSLLSTDDDLSELIGDVLASDRIQRWDADLSVEDVLPLCRRRNYASVVAAFHRAYAQSKGKPLWANIDIATLEQLHRANEWFPQARFVHIYRDARDVALSNQSMPYGRGNLAECADLWSRRLTTNFRMGRIVGPNRYMSIAYEDLVNQPKKTLVGLCSFLGVPFSESMLQFAADAEAKVPEDTRWLWPNLAGPLDRSATYRWKDHMSTNKRIVVEHYAGSLLKELGYETYDRIPRRLSAELLDLAYFLGRGGRMKRLLKAVGVTRPSKLERDWLRRERGPAR